MLGNIRSVKIIDVDILRVSPTATATALAHCISPSSLISQVEANIVFVPTKARIPTPDIVLSRIASILEFASDIDDVLVFSANNSTKSAPVDIAHKRTRSEILLAIIFISFPI
jgi:hypothetical protein